MTKLTLGTAKIIKGKTMYLVSYMTHGSFLVGEQTFGFDALNEALAFCKDRGLRIIETINT